MTFLEYCDVLQEVPFDSDVIVGTGAQATWRLRRADLMPRHFVITTTSGGAHIRPFSSDAVVSLNGRQLACAATPLHDGDLIAAGSGQFRFWADAPGETRSMLPMPVPALGFLVEGGRRAALSLNRTSTGIGGDESNAVVIDGASSFEAEIRREAGGHALHVFSPSSVRVNGKMISAPMLLGEGDEVQIGGKILRYTREPQPEVAPAEEPTYGTETLELSARGADEESYGLAPNVAVALRNPMRAVAFVSSVIAAVAIATLVFLHRGP